LFVCLRGWLKLRIDVVTGDRNVPTHPTGNVLTTPIGNVPTTPIANVLTLFACLDISCWATGNIPTAKPNRKYPGNKKSFLIVGHFLLGNGKCPDR
jgi:hypothetical protein